MAGTARRYSVDAAYRQEQHLRILEDLESLPLTDSCCDICHCDCLNSHRSSELSFNCTDFLDELMSKNTCRDFDQTKPHSTLIPATTSSVSKRKATKQSDNNNNNHHHDKNTAKRKVKSELKFETLPNLKSYLAESASAKNTSNKAITKKQQIDNSSSFGHPVATVDESAGSSKLQTPTTCKPKRKPPPLKRSKSASNLRSPAHITTTRFTRDCKILQDLVGAFETPRLEVLGATTCKSHTNSNAAQKESENLPNDMMNNKLSKSTTALPLWPTASSKEPVPAATSNNLKLCESMANLCLTPAVLQAFQKVPIEDKKILNRMAQKRHEKLVAKENAWLARKFFENERFERELFKCEQMEEYKRAVRDKQFQDYLATKVRINELAQRDFAELQRLKDSLQQKDDLTKRRLDALKIERGLQLCQRRCDELRKTEAVNMHQEQKHLDEVLRKEEMYHRNRIRLQRADEIRSQILDSQLKRLRYDNYIEQVIHEENWREAQEFEALRRQQLKEQIDRKCVQSQRFMENRQRRMAAISETAKISAELRTLVRNSVTPEVAALNLSSSTSNLAKLLFDRPISKLSQ